MKSYYVIRSGPFVGCGQYFCGLLNGDEIWSSRRSRAIVFPPNYRDRAELIAVGLTEEARVIRVRQKDQGST